MKLVWLKNFVCVNTSNSKIKANKKIMTYPGSAALSPFYLFLLPLHFLEIPRPCHFLPVHHMTSESPTLSGHMILLLSVHLSLILSSSPSLYLLATLSNPFVYGASLLASRLYLFLEHMSGRLIIDTESLWFNLLNLSVYGSSSLSFDRRLLLENIRYWCHYLYIYI